MGGIAPFGMLWLHSDHRDYILNTNNSNFTSTIIDDEDPITDNPIGTEPDPQPYTFPLLIFFRIICFLTFDSTNTLLDVCGLTMCKEHGGDFARQKLWGKLILTFSFMLVFVSIDQLMFPFGIFRCGQYGRCSLDLWNFGRLGFGIFR